MLQLHPEQIAQRLDQLTELSVELGRGAAAGMLHGGDITPLLERIVLVAKDMTGADGGTLYRPSADGRSLEFHISINDSLGLRQGASAGVAVGVPGVALWLEDGAPNLASVAAYAAHRRVSVNIDDVYQSGEFNFSGMRAFDGHYGYRSTSFLTVPMSDHEGELIGVLQLINAQDRATGAVQAFSATDQRFIEALAAQAAVALTNQLLLRQLEQLLESLGQPDQYRHR